MKNRATPPQEIDSTFICVPDYHRDRAAGGRYGWRGRGDMAAAQAQISRRLLPAGLVCCSGNPLCEQDEQLVRSAALLAITFALFSTAQVRAQDSANARRGLAYARTHCTGCHAVERGNRRSPNPRAPAFTAVAAVPGMTAMALHAALTTPHRAMPNIVLDPRDRTAVVDYILSLARD
jgi:mono/diheme cytochrome c family protein